MCRYKNGNVKRQSSFICLKCLNMGISGIQRNKQREKYHIKDLYCCICSCETKHVEVRSCDWLEEIRDEAEVLHLAFYG